MGKYTSENQSQKINTSFFYPNKIEVYITGRAIIHVQLLSNFLVHV